MIGPVAKIWPVEAIDQMARILFLPLALLLLTPCVLYASPLAQMQPQLKEHVIVDGRLVTLGDLFQNAGLAARTAVFRAPDPGTTGKVSVRRILLAAHRHGLEQPQTPAFDMVTIKRNSRIIEVERLKELIRDRLANKISSKEQKGKLVIKLAKDQKNIHIASQNKDEVQLAGLDWSSRSGRFTARFAVGDKRIVKHGTAAKMVQRIVASKAIKKGEVLSRADLALKYVKSSNRLPQQTGDMEKLVGLAARHRLDKGHLIRRADLEAPKVISKNQLVTILLEMPGLVLRTQGKALADAAPGETLKVLNTQSKRIIHATATASGLVRVSLKQTRKTGS